MTARQHDRRIRIGVFIGALTYFGLLAPYGLNIGEEGGTVYLIYRTLSGQRPYIDFISGYTPGYFYWHALLLQLFGVNLLVIRVCVAIANSTAVLLLYMVARPLLPPRFAVLPSVAYVALLQVFAATGCSFNVPYPSWYAVTLWLAGACLLQQWCRDRRNRWLLIAGLLAGISFSFKPNSGLFNLGADLLCIAVLCDGRPQLRASEARAPRILWWTTVVAVVAGVLAVFRLHLWGREGLVFVAPIVALAGLWAARGPLTPPVRHDATRPVLSLMAGFVVVTAPWALYLLLELGWARFVREVLFVNAGYEQFFYQAYRLPAWRDVALAVALIGFAVAADAVRRGWVSWRVALGVAGGAIALGIAWLVSAAPMPEGFERSVISRVQDAAFFVVPLIHWTMIAALGPRLAHRLGSVRTRALLVALVSACFMYLSAYPRSDFFHVSFSEPFTLVLGAVLLWWCVRLWRGAVPARVARWVDRSVLAATYAALLVVALPQLQIGARMVRHYIGADDTLVRVGLRRAPVLVEGGGAAQAVIDLVPLVDYLEQDSPDESLMTFPNLDLVCFLTGRHTPTRIGYFNPGWPDHVGEAEVIDALALQPPRLAVVGNPASLFFAAAPVYYFALREFMETHYHVHGTAGDYAILVRNGAAAASFVSARRAVGAPDTRCDDAASPLQPEVLRACLTRSNHGNVLALIQRVRDSGSAAAAAILAEVWAGGALQMERAPALLALRVIGEVGDARAAAFLMTASDTAAPSVRDARATALFNIAVREMIAPFQFGGVLRPTAADPSQVPGTLLRDWLRSPDTDPRLRFFAAWALSQRSGDTMDGTALVADLEPLLAEPNPGLQLVAATALARLSGTQRTLEQLIDQLANDPTFSPSLVLLWSRAHPATATPLLARSLAHGTSAQRETVAFIAGVLAWPSLRAALVDAASEPEARVRLASVWALGNSGDRAATGAVRAALSDAEPSVRRFAARALQRLDAERAAG